MREIIGFTTTIPVELVFAADLEPCDLNNVFITDANPMRYIEIAERDGFPKGMCSWIKGIYGVIIEKGISSVITVMEGDCSNTQALAEILRYKGIRTIPFSYPYDRDEKVLKRELRKLSQALGTREEVLKKNEKEIAAVRLGLSAIDRMTWDEDVVTGHENHLWLVRASDMLGDYGNYDSMVASFIGDVKDRQPIGGTHIGYIGVPPIILDLYEFLEQVGAHVVYNETQRQFSLPRCERSITKRYLAYTYPYGIFARLSDIQNEIRRRNLKGIIHYVQSFCFRAIEDVILRETLKIPVITIEGDLPRPLDTRTKLRLEAFIEMIEQREATNGAC